MATVEPSQTRLEGDLRPAKAVEAPIRTSQGERPSTAQPASYRGDSQAGTMISVSETFGPTLQGEGPCAGRRAVFIRLGLCNLDCSWCDTPFTWDWTGKNGVTYDRDKELARRSIADVADEARALAGEAAGTIAVVSGGEPFVQRKALDALVRELLERGLPVEIETNGTHAPSEELMDAISIGTVRLNVSPKLAGSGVDAAKAIKDDVLRLLCTMPYTAFKFVIADDADIAEVNNLVARVGIPDSQVWLMPEGRSPEQLAERFTALFDYAADRGWNATHRLHVLAHGDKRGI